MLEKELLSDGVSLVRILFFFLSPSSTLCKKEDFVSSTKVESPDVATPSPKRLRF